VVFYIREIYLESKQEVEPIGSRSPDVVGGDEAEDRILTRIWKVKVQDGIWNSKSKLYSSTSVVSPVDGTTTDDSLLVTAFLESVIKMVLV
jgi:hypothetical protein